MYESYYGFKSKPFQLTPDPAFFFASKLHKRAISYLQYGLSQAEGFIVITGGVGTGKTTIANSLLADLQQDIVAAQIVTPKLSPDELVKMVGSRFGINVAGKSKADIIGELEKYLYSLSGQGRRALLLVDEAQNLPLEAIEELRMLSNFQHAGKPLLQSFLLGQQELQPILRAPNMEQFRQRIVASCHLQPLNAEEVQAYIEFRLAQAGRSGSALFTEAAYEVIFDFSKGIPRKVNTLLDRALLFGYLEDITVFEGSAITQVVEEINSEMFIADDTGVEDEPDYAPGQTAPYGFTTRNGKTITEIDYYKDMLGELVDALDDVIVHKVKLTQHIDKVMKKKYQDYMQLKSESADKEDTEVPREDELSSR
ncbi:XrtA/PEP-CTERM system-associated ATPase [Alteromonas gilva]|uniref:XrtA-associated ATPase n=1 Tax=Alteromonas gilva TaxID=2987522 RepID=A0ABT5L1N5_9ALTE|nr:XrtA/PEP-CTERM system-associated ATPase [Alteromonas gilva]MDC8830316.1 XrtA-associated ATPase [Alteromonas gilva]